MKVLDYKFYEHEEVLEIKAIVEDKVLIRPEPRLDPPEYGEALCTTMIFWPEEPHPTLEEIETQANWIPLDRWEVVQDEY